MASYNCPPGYGCNDMASWTCTADDPYGSPAGSGSSRPAPPPLDAGALDAAVPDGATDDATSEDAGDDGA